jgi:hypothetical protein
MLMPMVMVKTSIGIIPRIDWCLAWRDPAVALLIPFA